jgi:hypothetical protein
MCSSCFNISHGGHSDIKSHLSADKHKRAANASASSSTLTAFFRNETFGEKELKLASTEGTFAYHAVPHNQTFRSMDCTSKLIQCVFEPKQR